MLPIAITERPANRGVNETSCVKTGRESPKVVRQNYRIVILHSYAARRVSTMEGANESLGRTRYKASLVRGFFVPFRRSLIADETMFFRGLFKTAPTS